MIVVIAEQQQGKLHRASWEAIAAAQQLAGGQPVAAVVLGAGAADAASELSQAAVQAVHLVDSPLLEPYTPDAYTDALQQVIAELKPSHVCCRTRIARATSRRSWPPGSIARS